MEAPIVARALAAAVAVARELGLRVDDARPIGAGSNVMVHLRPAPVVARVMSGTVHLHPDPASWLAREVAVGRHLAAAGAPAVAPSPLVDPGPHRYGGLWLTLWEHEQLVPGPRPAEVVGRSLRELHDALATCPVALPPRSDVLAEIDWLLRAGPADPQAEALAARRDRAADVLAADDAAAGRQPLHGDASLSNLLATTRGPRWNDLEDVCVGRVEWDVAGLLADARATHGAAFAAGVLAAYGRPCDPDALHRAQEVDALYGELWRRHRRRHHGDAAGPGER